MRKRKEYLEIGKIVAPHGVHGAVRVQPWCDDAEMLTEFALLYFDGGKTPVEILSAVLHKNVVLMQLNGVTTMDAAQALRGKILYAPRDALTLEENAYFIQDLVGLTVVDADNSAVIYGRLTDVLQTGANDVYEITRPDGRKALIPAIKQVVIQTDLDTDVMRIRPLEGLIDP